MTGQWKTRTWGIGSGSRAKVDPGELQNLLAAGVKVAVIAERFDCTDKTVRNTARRYGISIPRPQRPPPPPAAEPLPMYPALYEPGWLQSRIDAGLSLAAIAAEVGCSRSTVQRVANLLDVARRRTPQHPELRDPAWLRDAYVERQLSLAAIAAEIGASTNAVSQALARAGIPTRGPRPDPRLPDPAWLRHAYVDQHQSAPTIAEQLGVHPNTVYNALARAGIPRRPAGGEPSPRLADPSWLHGAYVIAGRPLTAIAAEVDRSPATVRRVLRRHGIRRPPPPRPPIQQLVDDWTRTPSITALATSYGAGWSRVEVWLAEAGIFVRPRPQVGRRQLRARLGRGDDVAALAQRFGLTRARMRVELLQHGLGATDHTGIDIPG